jgi:cell division protein FtsA
VIGPRDIEAALDAARRRAGEPQRRVLQFEPLRFTIDESEPVLDPIGFAGRVLSVEGCAVSAPSAALEALTACVRGAGAEVEDVVVGPAAAASAVMSQEEREGGALLIDLGAGSIGLAAFAAEGLVHAETLAMGGVRLTRDLAQRLETSFPAAERVKLAFSALRGACDPRETVPAPRLGRDGRLEASAVLRGVIADTVTPRLVESLVAVKERLALAGFAGPNAPARAVLVGGGAHIAGIRNLAAETLGMPVRLGRPIDLSGFEHGDASPAYACAAGALRRRLDADRRQQRLVAQRASIGELADHLRDKASQALCWLRDNF